MGTAIIGRKGAYQGAEFSIEEALTFGRNASECNVIFSGNGKISDKHCRIQELGGHIYLTDLGSTNGTYLSNGTRLTPQKPQELRAGEVFYLADTEEQFQVKGDLQQGDPPAVRTASGASNPLSASDEKKRNSIIIGAILAGVVILLIALFAGGAKKDTIVGKWEVVGGADTFFDDGETAKFIFEKDGTLEINMGYGGDSMSMFGGYSVDGSSITMTMYGELVSGSFKIDGDEMWLTLEGDTMKFERR